MTAAKVGRNAEICKTHTTFITHKCVMITQIRTPIRPTYIHWNARVLSKDEINTRILAPLSYPHPFTTVQTQQSPESLSSLEACCKMAATYSPAGVQYHRRGRA